MCDQEMKGGLRRELLGASYVFRKSLVRRFRGISDMNEWEQKCPGNSGPRDNHIFLTLPLIFCKLPPCAV